MEIKASKLISGKNHYFSVEKHNQVQGWIIMWNKKMKEYQIVPYDKRKQVFWFSNSLFTIVKQMNSMTGKYDTAVDDSKEWLNTTGATVDWKKRTRKFFSRKHK